MAAKSLFVEAFLNPTNVAWLISSLESQLTQDLQRNIKVEMRADFATYLVQIAIDHARYQPTLENLNAVNTHVLQHELKVHKSSTSHSGEFHKYFVLNQRFHVFPRGRPENEGAKFEKTSADYVVKHPVSKRFSDMQAFIKG